MKKTWLEKGDKVNDGGIKERGGPGMLVMGEEQ